MFNIKTKMQRLALVNQPRMTAAIPSKQVMLMVGLVAVAAASTAGTTGTEFQARRIQT